MAARKTEMTDRQRIEALLDRQKPDRVPLWPFSAGGFSSVYSNTSIADGYNKPEKAIASQRKTCEDFGWVFTPRIGYASFGGWEFGGDIKWPSSEFDQAPVVTRHPVQTEEEAWNLKIPDVAKAGIIPLMTTLNKMAAQEEHDSKPIKIFAYVGGSFTRACNIAGTENLCRWLIKNPDVSHHLLRMVTDFLVQLAQYWKDQFGTENILVVAAGEASTANTMISPGHFEEFAYPYLKEVSEKVLAMGYKHIYSHICGDQNANLPYWRHINFGDPGIISIGHEIELETAGEYFPDHIILGNLEPAIIQIGTPEEVYECSGKIIEKGKKLPGGFIFSPGCELPPRSNPENVMAMTRAVNDFGWYH